ncbi:MAG: glycosyltransferase family 2 protein [Chitinophagaceae bacterium]|nr:glycosyltransferase family 2 protein [Chitinophagaceae bacterium]
MNIAAVVILYHPDQQTVENILSYRYYVDKIYIVDNSENASMSIIGAIRNEVPKAVYIHESQNNGIAQRLNQVCKLAGEAGYNYILTMDQDSSFEETVIKNYFECFRGYPGKENVAMFGVQYENPQWASDKCNASPWTTLITSGSIVNLALFEQIGGFDENLFIDTVDFEYCYRSILKGFRIILFKNILLTHRLGITQFQTAGKTGKGSPVTLHSPVRLYYMLRNYLYLRSKYRKLFPAEMLQSRNAVLNRIKINLLHTTHRTELLRYIWRGVVDFKANRLGKYRKK